MVSVTSSRTYAAHITNMLLLSLFLNKSKPVKSEVPMLFDIVPFKIHVRFPNAQQLYMKVIISGE